MHGTCLKINKYVFIFQYNTDIQRMFIDFYTKINTHYLYSCVFGKIKFVSFVYFAVCFPLGNSPASEFYIPTFRNTLFHLHRPVVMKNSSYPPAYEDGTDNVPKSRHIKFRGRGITQKKSYKIQNTAKV